LTGNRGKLTDFGVATPIDFPTSSGTVRYWAPECFPVPSRRNEKSDVYALGLVIWELFFGNGQIPFSGWNKNDLICHIARHNGKEIIPSDAPPSSVAIINGCWKKKEDRLSVAKLMLDIQTHLDADTNASKSLQTTKEGTSSLNEDPVEFRLNGNTV
jgi:serine/threonine protein kinase